MAPEDLTRRWGEPRREAISGSLMSLRSDDWFSSHYGFPFPTIVSFTAQRDSLRASTPVLLFRHMGLWTASSQGKKKKTQNKTSSRALSHKYQNTESQRRPYDGTFVQSCMNMHAGIRAPWVTTTEKRRCWVHTQKHTHSQTVLCQRGGSLFIYCLYTEKRETASIM